MHTEILSRMSLFEGCDPEALYQLLREAPNSLRTYKEGEFIARQGDVCRSLFILIKGHVRTQMENAEGKQLRTCEDTNGECRGQATYHRLD